MRIHLTDASFRRIAQVTEVLHDDVVALARRVDSGDIEGDSLRIAIGNLAARYDVPETAIWGLMGEIRVTEREELKDAQDIFDEDRDRYMKPYTFDPDLHTRDADVGGQSHVTPWSNQERNIGDFGLETDQLSDQAQGAQSDVNAEGSRDTTKYEQTHPLESPVWDTPHRDTYVSPADHVKGFPGDIPGGSKK